MLPLALALWGAATTATTRQGGGHDAIIDTAPSAGSRTFYGLGGLSAGASTRMLLDYEPERRAEVLDLLFAPGVGFSFQILKLELGGDCQSSWGTEASHAHSANDTDPHRFQRGYEWWLAKEAVKRNPQITLATLAWCAPPWITLGEADGYYSPAGLQYHLDFCKCSRGKDVPFASSLLRRSSKQRLHRHGGARRAPPEHLLRRRLERKPVE